MSKKKKITSLQGIQSAVERGKLHVRMYGDLSRFMVAMEGKARFSGGPIGIMFWESASPCGKHSHYNAGVYVGGNLYRCTEPLADEECCGAWYEHFRQYLGWCTRMFGGYQVELLPWADFRAMCSAFDLRSAA